MKPAVVAGIAAAAVVGAIALLANTGNRRPAGPETLEARVAEATPKIEAALGLTFKTPPRVEVRSKPEVRRFVEQQFDDSVGRAQVAVLEATLKRLGLIPESMSLRALLLDLMEEQIAGYYDPRTKVLYVVDGADDETIDVTVSHELIHALQDQYINLDSVMRAVGNDDRVSAAQAVIEGQATYKQLLVMAGPEMAATINATWDRVREVIRNEQGKMPVFAGAPLVIQEILIFPYLSGAEFMRAYDSPNPGRVPFADMPTSTEQILHPPLYLSARDEPTTVTLPPLRSGTAVHENTLGEFATRLFLYEHLRDQQGAISAAAGWDGDRYVILRTPRGEGIAWVTVWDSQIDAAEFYGLAERTVDRRFGPSAARTLSSAQAGPGMTTGRAYTIGGRSITVSTGEIGTRPVVIYVDVPAGDDPSVFDLARLRLTQPEAKTP
jgi:hypothetical protein